MQRACEYHMARLPRLRDNTPGYPNLEALKSIRARADASVHHHSAAGVTDARAYDPDALLLHLLVAWELNHVREQRVLELRGFERKIVADALKQRAVAGNLRLFITRELEQRKLGNARQRLPDVVNLVGGELEDVHGFFEVLDRDLAPRGVVATLVQLVEAVEDVVLMQRTRRELKVPGVANGWLFSTRAKAAVVSERSRFRHGTRDAHCVVSASCLQASHATPRANRIADDRKGMVIFNDMATRSSCS
jgi:hypothetical protein